MMVGQVRVLRASNPYKNVIVGQPDVADVNVMTDVRFIVTARKEGLTSVLLSDEQGRPVQSMDIQVVTPVSYQKDSVRVRSFGSRSSERFYWCDPESGCVPDPDNTPLVSESTTVLSLPGGMQSVTTMTTPIGPSGGIPGGSGVVGRGNTGGSIPVR
jgi:hypothetical protein